MRIHVMVIYCTTTAVTKLPCHGNGQQVALSIAKPAGWLRPTTTDQKQQRRPVFENFKFNNMSGR